MDVTGPAALSRLTSSDLDDVTRFLHATWRHQYGNESYPAFSRQYLEWLYGGPHEDDTVLLGVRDSGRLVGFKAMIFRPLLVKGHPRRSHVATHLAVDLALPLADRVAALGAVALPERFEHYFERADLDTGHTESGLDTLIAFYDDGKGYHRSTASLAAQAGFRRSQVPFQHAIVSPRRVDQHLSRACAEHPGLQVRRASVAEAPVIANLFNEVARKHTVSLAVTPAWVRHHLFGLADSRVFMASESGVPTGFISCYALDTMSAAGIRRVVVIEYLIVGGAAASAPALVAPALQFSNEQGAKGVVIENATYLDAEVYTSAGLLPSTRRMIGSLSTRRGAVSAGDGLLIDVK
jgi:hypothetical protein